MLYDLHYNPSAAVQIEWLVSARECPLKWHAGSTRQLQLTTAERLPGRRKSDEPVVVLADLPDGDQSLQVLVGLVRVDVVQ